MDIFKKVITRLFTARKITKAVLVLSLIAPLAANAGVSCRGNMYGSILNTYGGYNSANYDPNYCTLGNYDTVEEVVVEGRRYTAPNWYDPFVSYTSPKDLIYFSLPRAIEMGHFFLNELIDDWVPDGAELYNFCNKRTYSGDSVVSTTFREKMVWELYENGTISAFDEDIVITWANGVGVYQWQRLPITTYRIWEKSWKDKEATVCVKPDKMNPIYKKTKRKTIKRKKYKKVKANNTRRYR